MNKMVAKKTSKKELMCPWCPFNVNGCGDKSECDFRSLPYEKEAIIKRIKDEQEGINGIKEELMDVDLSQLSPEEFQGKISSVIDVVKGIQIMGARLNEDFGVTPKELKKVIGSGNSSFSQKIRLAATMAKFKHRRKRGNIHGNK